MTASNDPMPTPAEFLVVGSGVMGLSTACELKRKRPNARVVVIDERLISPKAASSDLNKIIRADYPDPLYMKLALEAQESWRSDPIFQRYYHECGMLFAEEINMGRAAFDNYRLLGVPTESEIMSIDEARSRFSVFQDANWSGASECYYNPRSGWGEADEAMKSVFRAALELGVEFVQAPAKKLILGPARSCLGARIVQDGQTRDILARKTVLCVGAYTAKFLADTAPEWHELQVNGRMVAAAAVQCTVSYPAEQEVRLQQAPVHFIGLWHTHGESIPPFNGRLKLNCEVSFTNMTYHAGLDGEISIPPQATSQSTFSHDVPEGLKEEAANVVKNTYGEHIPGIKIESYRMCWDAVSPNQDFIIDYHPHCENLVLATAGSFHSWKFLPNIGKYVVQRIFGTLDKEMARRWAWDRLNVGAACEMYEPTRDLKMIGPFLGWPRPTAASNGAAKSVAGGADPVPWSEGR